MPAGSPGSPVADPELPDEVCQAFGLDGAEIETLAGGRTNRTMRVRAGRDLVIQQLRAVGDTDLLGVMENLVRLTSHLDWRRRTANSTDPSPSWYPELVPTRAGKPFLMDDDGDVWRAFAYRPGVIVRSAQPAATAASVARLYGRFAGETHDLGGPPLIETTVGFHDLHLVFDQLIEDMATADHDRAQSLAPHVDAAAVLRDRIERRLADDGFATCPQRVVHNDTKYSNVLLDQDGGTAIAVLDLDLAMMGPCWHDVGDLLRSASWHQAGTMPSFAPAQFETSVGAFIDGAGGTLSDSEIVTFALAGPRLSLELGLRYLNDHLRDQPNLRVDGTDGHLHRGVANLNLADEMFGAYDALRLIVDSHLAVGTVETKGTP